MKHVTTFDEWKASPAYAEWKAKAEAGTKPAKSNTSPVMPMNGEIEWTELLDGIVDIIEAESKHVFRVPSMDCNGKTFIPSEKETDCFVWTFIQKTERGSFEKLVSAFEKNPLNPRAFYPLAIAIVRSILRTLRSKSGSTNKKPVYQDCPHGQKQTNGTQDKVKRMQADVADFVRMLDGMDVADVSTGRWIKTGRFDSVLEARTEKTKEEAEEAFDVPASDLCYYLTLSRADNDGTALIQEAVTKLLYFVRTLLPCDNNGRPVPFEDWTKKPVTMERLKKRTFYKSGSVSIETEIEQLSPVHAVFKHVRSCVLSDGSVKPVQNRFSYVIKEMPIFAMDGNEVTERSEAVYIRSVSPVFTEAEAEAYDKFFTNVQLTSRETEVMMLLLSNYGTTEVCNRLKISYSRLKILKQSIAEKAVAHGYGNTSLLTMGNNNLSRPIVSFDIENGKPVKPVYYPSLEAAARITGVNTGSIRQVLNGKRDVAGGKLWRRAEDGKPVSVPASVPASVPVVPLSDIVKAEIERLDLKPAKMLPRAMEYVVTLDGMTFKSSKTPVPAYSEKDEKAVAEAVSRWIVRDSDLKQEKPVSPCEKAVDKDGKIVSVRSNYVPSYERKAERIKAETSVVIPLYRNEKLELCDIDKK